VRQPAAHATRDVAATAPSRAQVHTVDMTAADTCRQRRQRGVWPWITNANRCGRCPHDSAGAATRFRAAEPNVTVDGQRDRNARDVLAAPRADHSVIEERRVGSVVGQGERLGRRRDAGAEGGRNRLRSRQAAMKSTRFSTAVIGNISSASWT